MGNWYDEEDENEQQEQKSGKGLRSQLEGTLAENAELKKQLTEFQQAKAAAALQSVLQGKNLDPEIGEFILASGVDPSDSGAVDTWLAKKGHLFGYTPDTPEEQSAPDERAAAFDRIQNAQSGALPAGNRLQELNRRIQESDGSPESVQAILAEVPNPAS